jgi:hypothetical protein
MPAMMIRMIAIAPPALAMRALGVDNRLNFHPYRHELNLLSQSAKGIIILEAPIQIV